MGKKYSVIVASLTVAATIYILARGGASLQSARTGIDLFLHSVLPALLPFMVCATLLVQCGAAQWLGRIASPIMRPVFGCPGEGALALLMGLLCGYPSGARVAVQLYESGSLKREDARRVALLSSACGPAFITGVVGAGMLQNAAAGWVIAVSHWVAVLAVGAALGRRRRKATDILQRGAVRQQGGVDIAQALTTSLQTLAMVAGYIILFSVLAGVLEGAGVWQAVATGMLEISNGCAAMAKTALPLDVQCCLLSGMVSFGGLCVLAQTMGVARSLGLSFRRLLAVKAAHAGVSALVCAGLLRLTVIRGSVTAMAGQSAASSPVSFTGWYWVAAVLILLIAATFLWRKTDRRAG